MKKKLADTVRSLKIYLYHPQSKKPQICELQQNDFGVVAILYKNCENWSKHLTCLKLHTNPNDGTYPLIYYQPEFGGDMVGSGSSVHS
jgi:hypothetical protein